MSVGFGLAWLGSIWLGLVCFGLVWLGLARLQNCASFLVGTESDHLIERRGARMNDQQISMPINAHAF
jgi:hypothetical protein